MTGESRIPCNTDNSPPASTDAKAALRTALLGARRAIDPAEKARWDAAIGARVVALCISRKLRALGVYWPLRGEPDLHDTYPELARAGVRLRLPVVLARDAPLRFAEWTPGEPMEKDGMGVAVPLELRLVERPPALLVPCLGFNAEGYRLGYGGGYYDRTLEAVPRPLSVGIAYACLAAEFASAPHDVALDLVITEAS